jgi:hypothetical protein
MELTVWGAIQYVGTGLSLVAFVVAALLFAYRTRLHQRAEIIKSAPEKERLEAIAATAEFFRVDVSGLSARHRQEIILAQIKLRARRELLFAVMALTVALLLSILAVVTIVGNQRGAVEAQEPSTVPVQSPPKRDSPVELGGPDIKWDTSRDHPVVDFSLPYRNIGSRKIRVYLEVKCVMIPRGSSGAEKNRILTDTYAESFTLEPGEVHVVKGSLHWEATNSAVPRLVYPPADGDAFMKVEFLEP